MSQFHPSQHGGDSDVQMWQQQMMYKQLQEYQRQQQQHQLLDHGARLQNSFGQFHAPAKLTPADQMPTMMNMNEPSSYALSNNSEIGGSRLGSNSQMFNTGSAHWEQLGVSPGTSSFVNGSVYSNSQDLMRPMGFVPNKVDQSFYSLPASMGKGSGNQYSQFPGFPANSHNAIARAGSDQSDKATTFLSPVNSFRNEHGLREQGMSNPVQNIHENGRVLSDTATQSQGSNMKVGSPVLGNHLQHAFHVQDFHGRINKVEFQSAPQIGPTSSTPSLDPTEEKFLYGNDEDSNWGDLLRDGNSSGGAHDHVNSFGKDRSNSALPFLQGSWSAIMQNTLQSTSSENGLQEEMSGVNFQNKDTPFANNSTLPGLEQRQPVALNNINIRSSSPNAQPSHSHDGATGTINNPKFTSFQDTIKSPYDEQEKLSHESPTALTNCRPTTETDRYFQQSLKQNHFDEYGSQEQVNLLNAIWAKQKHGLPKGNSNTSGAHFMPQNAHGLGVSQQSTSNRNFSRESSNNQSDWKCRSPNGQDINSTPDVSNSNKIFWKSGVNTNSVHGLQQSRPSANTVQVSNDCSGGKNVGMISTNMAMISQDRNQMVVGRSGENFGTNRTPRRMFSETSAPQGNNVQQGSADFNQMYLNAISTEGHISNNGQHLSTSARRNSSAGVDVQNLGQSGQKTMDSYAMQNHLSGSSEISAAHYPANSVSNTELMSQSIRPPNNQENLLGGHCQMAGNMASANEKIALVEEQLKSQHAIANNYSSGSPFRGFDATLSQNPNSAVQTSQHMLQQFLHKVENSSNYAVAAGDMPNRSVTIATAHQQLNQPSLHEFGLKLAPPSQRQPTAGHLWTSRTSVDSKQHDHSVHEDQQQLPSTPGQSLPSGHPSRSSPFHSSEIDHTGLSSARVPQISSGQQYPVVESKSASLNSLFQQPQQGSSATMFKNVWTNISAQRLAGVQHNEITPNILQSMLFPNTVGDSNLWGFSKDEYQRLKVDIPSDAATTPNSENEVKRVVDNNAKSTSYEKPNIDQMGDILSGKKESLQRHSLDGILMQQCIMNPREGENMSAKFLPMSSSFDKASSVNSIGLHGSPTPSSAQQQNYSLLQQMQGMKPVDIDQSNTSGKRLKTTEMSSDAVQVDWSAGQRVPCGANNSVKTCADNTEASRVPSSFSSDVKMLSFSSRNNEERTPTMLSRLHSRELSSQDMATARTDLQNEVSSLGTSPAENFIERNDGLRINPHMALQQHGSYRNGQNLAMYNAKNAAAPYNLRKVTWSMDSSSAVEHGLDCSNSVVPGHSSLKASSVVRRPKKRKFKASVLVSWNRIVEGHQKFTSMSYQDMDWARAANRLMEKVGDDADIWEDAPIFYLPRKRLILTTRLIQQLLPAVPASILRAQAVSVYESATYTVAKLTIGDACSMALFSSRGTATLINKSSEQTKNTEKMEDKFLKALEFFTGRFKKIENDFVSLNKRASMLDVQLECQDVERISIVNRLGRFHGRNHHAVGVEGSSTSELAPRRIFLERHVMAFAVPGNLPEAVSCLSL